MQQSNRVASLSREKGVNDQSSVLLRDRCCAPAVLSKRLTIWPALPGQNNFPGLSDVNLMAHVMYLCKCCLTII